IAARQVLRSQRIVRYFDARFHRRDAIVDNSSNRHAPKPHPDHFAHTDWRVGDARAQTNPEKIEKNDREDETENSEHREADESKRKLHGETVAASLCEAQRRVCRHPASRRPEGDGCSFSLQSARDGIRIARCDENEGRGGWRFRLHRRRTGAPAPSASACRSFRGNWRAKRSRKFFHASRIRQLRPRSSFPIPTRNKLRVRPVLFSWHCRTALRPNLPNRFCPPARALSILAQISELRTHRFTRNF